ncbi:unnamed protein product [marine sediment metagenome]|uniref:DUF2203 domain-containing protein n=1 Tax=marine sediment metagenome TaxID=412755 RepID=X1CN34_9ZZZZ
MTLSNPTKKTFTIRMANMMLPLVQSITADIVRLADEVEQTRARLDYLNDGRVAEHTNDVYGKELHSIEKHTDRKSETVHSFVRELSELNLIPDRVVDGFVDFPALRNSEPVCLCWQLGEREVKHWHGSDEDCSQRRPVDLELIRQSGELSFSESV